jgi:hypothetical protein
MQSLFMLKNTILQHITKTIILGNERSVKDMRKILVIKWFQNKESENYET